MSTDIKQQAISTVTGYIKSIYAEMDELQQSKRQTSNYLVSTLSEVQAVEAINNFQVSTIQSLDQLTTELREKEVFLIKLKKA
jgi:hypothetical protein